MAFLEFRLPTGVVRGSRGGPRGGRTDVQTIGGRLKQNFHRAQSLHHYTLDFGNKWNDREAEDVRAAFYVVMFEHYEGFRVRDWNDYLLTQGNSALFNDGGGTWKVCRKYTAGAISHLRRLKKLAASPAPVIWRTRGATTTVAADAVVDVNAATVTFGAHVAGDTYTAVGEFDIPVTFASPDALDAIGLDGSADHVLAALGTIELMELPG